MFRKKLFFTPISNPSPKSSSKKLRFLANLKVPTKGMITKMQFWHIFNLLLSERHNAFYNRKGSNKHVLLSATISNEIFSQKTKFYSTYQPAKTNSKLSSKASPPPFIQKRHADQNVNLANFWKCYLNFTCILFWCQRAIKDRITMRYWFQ